MHIGSKLKQHRLSMLALLSLTVLPCLASDPIVAKATGSGHAIVDGALRTFAFQAHRYSDGSSLGELQLYNRAQDIKTHVDITCLHVSGNVATMTGVAQHSDSLLPGTPVWVRVVDNGAGKNAPPDRITLVYFPVAIPCNAAASAPLLDVERGNIQVH